MSDLGYGRRLALVLLTLIPALPGFICDEDQCLSEQQCADRCQALVEDLAVLPPLLPATTGLCIEYSEAVVGCGCFSPRGDGEALTAEVLGTTTGDIFLSTEGCTLTGRLGGCLLPPENVAGCTIGDDAICEDMCALVDSLRTEDLSTPITDARLVQSECALDCRCTVQSEGQCTRVLLFDVTSTDVTLDGVAGGNALAGSRGPCDG